MDFHEFSKDCSELVAASADVCMKPWKHAAVIQKRDPGEPSQSGNSFELILRIECRSQEGYRLPENDLDLEIFRSGMNLNLILGWTNKLDRPILWQGQHSVWMDGNSGQRCQAPQDGSCLEGLARRLRASFGLSEED